MNEPQQKVRHQLRLARLEIVAELYKRGKSMRQIKAEVMRRLGLDAYSLRTVHNDVHVLLKEWRESRINDIDTAIELELVRIDDIICECWEQWERSKTDYTKTSDKVKGRPPLAGKGKSKDGELGESDNKIGTVEREHVETKVVALGDVSYLSEIRYQLIERRKLLGLYAPEKKEVLNEYDLSSLTPEQREALRTIGEQALDEKEKPN